MARSASVPDPRQARHIIARTGLVALMVGTGLASDALPAGRALAEISQAAPPCEAPLGFGAPGRLESSDVVVLFRTVPSPIEIGQHFTVEALVCPTPPIGAAAGFMVGTDTFTPERLFYVPEHATWSRAWLADLPPDVAERIAWKNGEALFGGALGKRP